MHQLLAEIAIESCRYWDVENAIGAELVLKLIDKMRLCAGNFWTRPMA